MTLWRRVVALEEGAPDSHNERREASAAEIDQTHAPFKHFGFKLVQTGRSRGVRPGRMVRRLPSKRREPCLSTLRMF